MSDNAISTRHGFAQPVLIATAIAGTLDITAAIVTSALRGTAPLRLLQSVATGLLGEDAYSQGLPTAVLGLLLHFSIMLAFACFFIFIYRRTRIAQVHTIWAGIIYGVAVYTFMNVIVLPLSAFPHKIKYGAALLTIGIVTHILCVGLPMAIVARRFAAPK